MSGRRSWRPSNSVHSCTACCRVCGENSVHCGRLVRRRVRGAIGALQAAPQVVDHVQQGAQRTRREAEAGRRGLPICELRVPCGDQLTRAVLHLDDHVGFAAMSLVSNHPDHLPSQGMVARCDTNGLEDAGIHPPLLLTGC
jgi:hypothetical protein